MIKDVPGKYPYVAVGFSFAALIAASIERDAYTISNSVFLFICLGFVLAYHRDGFMQHETMLSAFNASCAFFYGLLTCTDDPIFFRVMLIISYVAWLVTIVPSTMQFMRSARIMPEDNIQSDQANNFHQEESV